MSEARRAFVGAATSPGGGSPAEGVTILEIDGGAIAAVGVVRGLDDPMYLALSPDASVLYAVHELDHGLVSAWAVDRARLRPLGDVQSSGGSGPCHLSVHPSGSPAFVANYGSGSVAVLPVLGDGSLGPATSVVQHEGPGPRRDRQEGPHAHMMIAEGGGSATVLAVDLGTDAIHRYRLDGAGGLTALAPIAMPAGSGPRHLVVDGRTAYVAGELDATLSVVDLDAARVTATVSTLTDPAETAYPSAIRLSPDGRFVYVANRGPDTIAVLAVDDAPPRLVHTVPTGGTHPRDLVLSPDGAHLYVTNQFSDTITAFALDPSTGAPRPVGRPFATPSPACIVFA